MAPNGLSRRRLLGGAAVFGAGAIVGGIDPFTPERAAAAPPVPEFTRAPEGYAAYDGQDTCDPIPKPGVVEFQQLVLNAYPSTGDSGISRDCGVGGQSEHKEGRAWDWAVSATSQANIADNLLDWLLATRDGHRHALLRRLGIMYIIWNRRIFRAYEASAGWQAYTGENPHTDHVHFSFGWAGARKQTTWWTARGPNLVHTGALGVSTWGANRLDVFARAGDGTVRHKWYTGGGNWSPWQSLGGTLTSGPAAVSWGVDRIDAFARGGNDQLIHKWFTPSGGWSSMQGLGGRITSAPAVAAWAARRLDVFARGGQDQLVHLYFTGTEWRGWQGLGGELTSAPAVASWGPERLDVFARGGNDQLIHKWFTRADGWSGWQNLGGELTSAPAVASWGPERLDVFARGGNDQLIHKWFTRADGWSGWQDLGGTLTSSPAVAAWGERRLDVFARGGQDQLVHLYYTGNEWRGWEHLGNVP
jgi:hypothetical protein